MLKTKRIISILLSVLILFQCFTMGLTALATNDNGDNYYVQYTGTTRSNGYDVTCTFVVNKIVNNKFQGTFSASGIGQYSFSGTPIEGSVYQGKKSFTCFFTVKFFNDRYYSSMCITVHPYEGTAQCLCAGSWHMNDFTMYGTCFELSEEDGIIDNDNFNENDMQMCMELSNMAYSEDKSGSINLNSNDYSEFYSKYNISRDHIESYHYKNKKNKNIDIDSENAPLNITYRINDDNSCDMIVAIRGTYHDEWNGNVQITGSHYISSLDTHYNFNKGKESIKSDILEYYNKYLSSYDTVNLIITGHSRGAAISNLYAKEATDKIIRNNSNASIPDFKRVTAYTYACPNVAKYDSSMETSYNNIFNFCFKEDLVPTVPLTSPTYGWNYWRYGETYLASLTYRDNTTANIQLTSNSTYVSKIHKAVGLWPTVSLYYNKPIISISDPTNFTTLYNVANNWSMAASASKFKQAAGIIKGLSDRGVYVELAPLIVATAPNLDNIKYAHSNDTYDSFISNNGSKGFYKYTYNDYLLYNTYCLYSDSQSEEISNFNPFEVQKLTEFYNFGDNCNILNWNINDPNSWEGITWNESGNVEIIELPYMELTGMLDLSNFSNLTNVDVSFNHINTINISNCSSLNYLDIFSNDITSLDVSTCINLNALNCGCNDLSNEGLSLQSNINLISLTCDYCKLSTIDISSLNSLEELSCSFNNLTTLNISNCTELNSLTCCYNYLDIHEGGALYNTLENLMFNDCYVNYYPQAVPDNASFNTTELNVLKTFANTANNNSELDWLDDSGNIDTQKLQNNVLFEYDGSKYRVVAIDISDTNVEGTLNLTSFAQLKELYCENTKLVSLNLNGCTKLNTLHCDGSNLTTLTLPSNSSQKTSPLYDVSCEYNYLDTSIFTQNIITYVEFKAGGKIEYLNQKGEDSSTLLAAISFANTLEENDYSTESFEELSDILEECNYYNFDNLYLTQNDIDELTADILTAIYNLKAYFDVKVSAPNGSLSIAYDDETSNDSGTYSILYGTTVTLNATADNDCTFVGWYDTVSNRYLSNDAQYSFKVDSNINLKAVIIPNGSATLTFANYSNWIAGTVTKTTTEWAELTSIEDFLPNVPYRYGYSNGRWVYNDSAVLALLQSGQDVNIGAEYDEDNASFPTPRVAVDKPVLDLYYNYDSDNLVGSFVMAAGFPEDIEVESVGIAFYYKKANQFDPTDNFTLLLNNKMLVGRFNTDVLEDVYITNMNKMTSTYNWAARGYVTYYDENNNLVTAYSNQINVIDTRNADEIPVETFSLPEDDLDDDIPPIHTGIDVFNGEDD